MNLTTFYNLERKKRSAQKIRERKEKRGVWTGCRGLPPVECGEEWPTSWVGFW